jgi:hypothetical protein
MKKSGLQFLAAAVLAAMVLGACMSPLEAPEDPVEYDAQGRRLVTVTVDLDSAARAVNAFVARAYIDFYEVVFKGPGTASEYYSATTTKGAGNRLSLRVPVGDYTAYLAAGYLRDDQTAVLLAQASVGTAQAADTTWAFTLAALDLRVNGTTTTSASGDPIFVSVAGTGQITEKAPAGIPYYKPAAGVTVEVAVNTNVAGNIAYPGGAAVAVVPLIRKTDKPPVILSILSPTFDYTSGKLSFNFIAPTGAEGLSNVGFDISVAALSATRNNGVDPVLWHIRNGIHIDAYDNGAGDATNTGAGLVFAFGSAIPEAEDTYGISFVPPIP